jgi:hypothetical protein
VIDSAVPAALDSRQYVACEIPSWIVRVVNVVEAHTGLVGAPVKFGAELLDYTGRTISCLGRKSEGSM